MASIYANLLEQKKAFTWEKSSTPRGFSGFINMAAVSLFWNTDRAAVTSCENALLSSWKTQAWELLGCVDTVQDSSCGDRKKIPNRVSVQQHIKKGDFVAISKTARTCRRTTAPILKVDRDQLDRFLPLFIAVWTGITSVVFVWAKRECERELLLRTCTPNSICLIVCFSSCRKWERDAWLVKYCAERECFQWSNFKTQIQTRHSLE